MNDELFTYHMKSQEKEFDIGDAVKCSDGSFFVIYKDVYVDVFGNGDRIEDYWLNDKSYDSVSYSQTWNNRELSTTRKVLIEKTNKEFNKVKNFFNESKDITPEIPVQEQNEE